jgi:hypothetical protein
MLNNATDFIPADVVWREGCKTGIAFVRAARVQSPLPPGVDAIRGQRAKPEGVANDA